MSGVPATRHRMALVDLMVMVASAAIAMGGFRALLPIIDWESPWPNILASPPGGWTPQSTLIRVLEVQVPALPVLCAWTITLPILRLRHRGRSWRRIARQPGTAAVLSALVGWAWATANAGWMFAYRWSSAGFPPEAWRWLQLYFANMMAPMGMSVAIAWTLLATFGLWRPAPEPLDRIGRVVGTYWIVVGLLYGGIFGYHWMI